MTQHDSRNEAHAASYAQAVSAWTRGDYDGTLGVIEALPTSRQSAESLLLCARALIRKGRLTDAREWLNRSVSSHRTPDNYATELMLQGVIEAREGNPSGAEALFARALELKPHYQLRAEVNYERAIGQFSTRRYDDARTTLRAIRPYGDVLSVKSLELEGRIELALGNYRSALAAFGSALTELPKYAALDMSLRALLLREYSEMVAELDHDHGEKLVCEAEGVTYGLGVVREQIQTLRYIGLMHRRAGRLDEAMRAFGQASSIVPGSPWQILGTAECASLCVDQENSLGARGYVAQAQHLAGQIEWSSVVGEQRMALLVLAQVVARLKEGDAALALLQWYQEGSQSHRSELQVSDDRLSIFERHTMGLVQAACGDVAKGRDILSGAHLAWTRVGYRWRALEALTDIKRIDPRRMPDWLLANASNVHRKILAGDERPARSRQQMTGAELRERFARQYDISLRLAEILQLAVRGRSNKEIALEIGIAERTIKNRVIQLYGVVGVQSRGTNSRAELVSRCMAEINAS